MFKARSGHQWEAKKDRVATLNFSGIGYQHKQNKVVGVLKKYNRYLNRAEVMGKREIKFR